MGREEAISYEPKEKTYGIRIGFSGFCSEKNNTQFKRLENSYLYVPHNYYFDDVEPSSKSEFELPITMEISTSILNDFKEQRNDCSTLMVHCEKGMSRSPAVAMALNGIFNLGRSNKEIASRYPNFNIYVVQILYRVARDLMLK